MWNLWNQKNSEIFGETGMFADCDEVGFYFRYAKFNGFSVLPPAWSICRNGIGTSTRKHSR